jgi:hypothetical protein
MKLLEVGHISNYYPIEPVIEVKEIINGNTSNAKLLLQKNGKYILRKLKDTKQAMTEFLISNELLKHNISPAIL